MANEVGERRFRSQEKENFLEWLKINLLNLSTAERVTPMKTEVSIGFSKMEVIGELD